MTGTTGLALVVAIATILLLYEIERSADRIVAKLNDMIELLKKS